MSSDWEAIEERLVSHSAARRSQIERRDRRRHWLPWLVGPVLLPCLGAAVFLFVLERAGGDFGGWPAARAIGVVAAAFAVPALLAGWFARREGAPEAIAWALVCLCAQVALVVGVGFLALDLGPG